MSVLVLVEHDQEKIKASSLTTLTAATQIEKEVSVLVLGYSCEKVLEQLKLLPSIQVIYYLNDIHFSQVLAENAANAIVQVVRENNFQYLLAPATTFGKNTVPRVAALLDVAPISDVISIVDENTYRRPIYAGNAIETVKSLDAIQILTVRTTAFAPQTFLNAARSIETIALNFSENFTGSKFINLEQQNLARPELTSAQIVISGGRGLKTKDNFAKLIAIADRMHAAVGASRAAVDAELVPNDWQVGQTGKIVAPKLYIAVGISGAIQHLAGMKDSKIIVAINKDPDAPIFQIADYGLVGNIEDILPRWEKWLSENL